MTILSLTADKPFSHCATRIRLSTAATDARVPELDNFITLTLSTGACDLQTYLTADHCREFAAHLLQLAAETTKG